MITATTATITTTTTFPTMAPSSSAIIHHGAPAMSDTVESCSLSTCTQDIQVVCPFCLDPLDTSDIQRVQSHLAAAHSFHVPHSHAITDWPGLLLYLETKIHDLGHCLHCHAAYWNPHWTPNMVRVSDTDDDCDENEEESDNDEELPEMRDAFRSGQDALKHMFARGHNAIRMESGGWREYASFYDAPMSLFVAANLKIPHPATTSRPAKIGAAQGQDHAASSPTPASTPPSGSGAARLVSGSRRTAVTRPSALAIGEMDQPPCRVRAVVRAGDCTALAQSLALQHSIPVHQANKLVRSGAKATALTTMSSADVRHLAKTMEQVETSARRQEMKEYTAQAVKANKAGRKRFLHVRPRLEPHTFNPALIN
ncbi:hypothetical protein BCR44DRAFT_392918, partial [Catenaria anguillulae PL171]